MSAPRILALSALTLVAALTSGCRTFTPPAKTEKIEGSSPHWFHYDATRRGGVALPADSKMKVIAEPAPDAALEVVAEIAAKLDTQGADADLQAKFGEKIVELGKVTERIKFLREAL